VINIGSVASSLTAPTTSVYTATKGAVDAVTRTLAKELGPRKIRVNSINPGVVETEGAHAAGVIGSDFQKGVEAQTPLGRIAQPVRYRTGRSFSRIRGFCLGNGRDAPGIRWPTVKLRHSVKKMGAKSASSLTKDSYRELSSGAESKDPSRH
jgi:hypothetical protein